MMLSGKQLRGKTESIVEMVDEIQFNLQEKNQMSFEITMCMQGIQEKAEELFYLISLKE